MSVVELKARIAALGPDDRRELAALIINLNRQDSPEYFAEMDRRLDSVGVQKIFRDDLQKVHRDLTHKGK